MRHICILLHGIEVESQSYAWNEELAIQLHPWAGGRIEFLPRKYGYVSGFGSWLNWGSISTGQSYRQMLLDHEEIYFRNVQQDAGLDTRISMIAHSLGGYIVQELMKRGIKFHNVISLYAAANEYQDWREIEDRFSNYYVYWSPYDEILPSSNFGQLGLFGPQVEHPRVYSIKTTETHKEFMDTYTQKGYEKLWVNQLEAA